MFPVLRDITLLFGEYLKMKAGETHQIIFAEDPKLKSESLLKRSCVKMAKIAVCVAALVLLVALVESGKFDVNSFCLLIIFYHE